MIACVEHNSSISDLTSAFEDFLVAADELRFIASGCILILGQKTEHSVDIKGSACPSDLLEKDESDREQHQAALRECARLLATVGMATTRVMNSQMLFSNLRSSVEPYSLGNNGDKSARGGSLFLSPFLSSRPGSNITDTTATATAIAATLTTLRLLHRMYQEGYHPEEGGASFSVVMSREEKMQHLAGLR